MSGKNYLMGTKISNYKKAELKFESGIKTNLVTPFQY